MKKRTTVIVAAGLMLATAMGIASAQKSHDSAVGRNLAVFNSIVKELERSYVDTIRTDEAFADAIDALLANVDPYTEYYTAEDQEKLELMTTGEYGGIGSYIMERDGATYISEPYKDSPAALSGLMAGDKLLRIDTTDLKGMSSTAVTKLLKGQPGTKVQVRVQRPYAADSILDITITRAKMSLPTVPYYGTLGPGDNTGYIALNSFTDKSTDAVRTALEEFKADEAVENVILDLRGNGGGLLESAVQIVGNFVPKGTEVVRTRYRNGKEQVYKTTKSPLLPDVPLVVLIDGGSASSSEITAGAIQDLDRGVLMGTRSFGKGLVQSTRSLPYDGLLKVTIAKYYIPSGRLIQALDYSHRNPDGSVGRVPDSLTNVYKTLHGREVRDGGGLQPDSVLDWGTYTPILYTLMRDNWIFDYATKFRAEHDTIAGPKEFVVTDEIYADFKNFLNPDKFSYDKRCEEVMTRLREVAKEEGYLNEETTSQIDALAKALTHDLDHDLDVHRREIERYLGSEIVGRYYYAPGKAAYELRYDVGVDKALDLFSHPDDYRKILTKKK